MMRAEREFKGQSRGDDEQDETKMMEQQRSESVTMKERRGGVMKAEGVTDDGG